MTKIILILAITTIAFPTFAQNSDTLLLKKPKTTLSIIGVGDLMLGSTYPQGALLPPNMDCFSLIADVTYSLRNADLTIGNLEGCLSDIAPREKICRDTTICYAFRMPEKFGSCFKDAGFDVLTIANNHSGDFGYQGRESTVKILDSLGIYHAGWIKFPTAIFSKDSIKYGIASFAPNSGTVDIRDVGEAKRIVAELAAECQIVIVTFHGGAEGAEHQHVTRQIEEFYGENRGNVYEFAHALIDAGADLVFGHGPHVPRAVELYNDRFIAYSLGNFCTYGKFNTNGPNGLAPMIKVTLDTTGVFMEGQILSAWQPGKLGTFMDSANRAAQKIKQLTEADFPETLLNISETGLIERKL
jgi:poly-gamma-glutamate capsule biosynthesis protein CapA/YwtB (metallophosphatase superfamily)